MRAMRIHEYGGPDVLRDDDVPEPAPGAGQALVAVEASGLNFIDVYQRTGAYPVPLPATLGLEGAGTVVGVGAGVTGVAPGDRVAWTGVPGAYADSAVVPANRLVPLPDGVTARQGAAIMLQGMTAHYLATDTYALQPGDTCLVHAGAGGVGLLLTQMARLRGARVITTVSTPAKADLSRAAGASDVVLYTQDDVEAAVKGLTGNRGVQVVYDSVGRATFDKSLNCLAPRGMMVLFGQASGPVPPFDLQVLAARGSLFITRPTLNTYIASDADLRRRADDLFRWVGEGTLRLRTEHEYPLAKVADAHRALEARETTGKVLLIP
ncbi:MAG: quinone oxidoreductase [Acidobacteria bacterium]|nr:quinone oxidoreductase [Acidobacteriota bacterium]